jgi:hypothetical protein
MFLQYRRRTGGVLLAWHFAGTVGGVPWSADAAFCVANLDWNRVTQFAEKDA